MLWPWFRSFRRSLILLLLIASVLVPIYLIFKFPEYGPLIFSRLKEGLYANLQEISLKSHGSFDPVEFQDISSLHSVDFHSISGSGLSSDNQSCVHPQLMLWNPEIRKHFKDPKPLRCSETEENWLYTLNGTFRISEKAIQKHGDIVCTYTPIYRGADDYSVIRGNPINSMRDGDPLTSDVFEANCAAADGEVRTDIYVGVAPYDSVQARRREGTEETGDFFPLDLDIIIFGYDSTSRTSWLRNLPNSYKYLVEVLGAVVLEGYNILGDGTSPNLVALLTGQTLVELPEARRGFRGTKTVDDFPWIWKSLKNLGYVTQWGEDDPGFAPLAYRMVGFKNQPVDHYMRYFYLVARKNFSNYFRNCLGSLSLHRNMLNWVKDFVNVYARQRKFSFCFHSDYSHDSYTDLRLADNELEDFLEYLHTNGHLDKAMLILMSDHGARFQALRNTEQGKYEERMPFFSVRLPPGFQDKYPNAVKNLKTNAKRLVTAFDIHETFHDIMNFKGSGQGDISQRGISLFKEIPKERTCADAGIEPHWCACLSWTNVKSDDDQVRQAALAIVEKLNSFTEAERSNCVQLRLAEVTKALKLSATEELFRFRWSADVYGRIPDLTGKMNTEEGLYQITFRTEPGDALYEATIRFSLKHKWFKISDKEISRINIYGNQPHCVMERLPHLRPYCFCILPPPTP